MNYSAEYVNKWQSIIVMFKTMINVEYQKENKLLKDKELKLTVSTYYFEMHDFSVYSFRVHFIIKELNMKKYYLNLKE